MKGIKMKQPMRQYRSFDEIDRDLKLLKLQQDISREEISLSVNRTRESMAPKEIFREFSAKFLSSSMFYKMLGKIMQKKTSRRK